MPKRFFKLLYVLSLIVIALSLPFYLLTTIQFDAIVTHTYKARCLFNNQYVVLQGMQYNQPYILDEYVLKHPLNPEYDDKLLLNFYCKYYDEVQSHITAYVESKTRGEQVQSNINFFKFKNSVISNVSAYPPLYRLEEVDKDVNMYHIYGPMISWLVSAGLAFLLLQLLKLGYVYVAFNKIVWYPFRQSKAEHDN